MGKSRVPPFFPAAGEVVEEAFCFSIHFFPGLSKVLIDTAQEPLRVGGIPTEHAGPGGVAPDVPDGREECVTAPSLLPLSLALCPNSHPTPSISLEHSRRSQGARTWQGA